MVRKTIPVGGFSMSTIPFLTEAWIGAVSALQSEYRDRLPNSAVKMRANQVVTGVPFGDGTANLHIDTTEGHASLGAGHLDPADVTITTDYETAKAFFVQQDQQAVMQAFMQGKIKVQGDMAKLMVPPPPKNDAQKELDQKIRELTAF